MTVSKIPHRNIALVLAAALLLVLFTGIASADVCIVADPTGTPLNVRGRPSQHAPIIGALNNGITVSTRMSRGDWVHIVPHKAPGKSGWVWRKFIDCAVQRSVKRIVEEVKRIVEEGGGIAWDCAGTIVGVTDEDLGPSTAGSGPDGKPIGNDQLTTIWVANPPREGFVFKQYETPHAYATWSAELNGEPCKRKPWE
jgi:uncharacterized protein YraI